MKLHANVYLIYDSKNIDLTKVAKRFEEINISGKTSVELKPDEAHIIVQGIINGQKLTRKIEIWKK